MNPSRIRVPPACCSKNDARGTIKTSIQPAGKADEKQVEQLLANETELCSRRGMVSLTYSCPSALIALPGASRLLR